MTWWSLLFVKCGLRFYKHMLVKLHLTKIWDNVISSFILRRESDLNRCLPFILDWPGLTLHLTFAEVKARQKHVHIFSGFSKKINCMYGLKLRALPSQKVSSVVNAKFATKSKRIEGLYTTTFQWPWSSKTKKKKKR